MANAVKQVFLAAAVVAACCGAPPAMGQQSEAEAVAPVLVRGIAHSREKTMLAFMRSFRAAAGDDQILTEEDIELHRQNTFAAFRGQVAGQVFRRWLKHDLDGDNVVTREEAVRSISVSSGQNSQGKKDVEWLFKQDADGDGKITITEVLGAVDEVADVKMSERRGDQLGELFKLDPDGDKQLTVGELEGLVQAAFARFDLDGNGVLSDTERKALRDAVRAAIKVKQQRHTRACKLPPADPRAEILLIAAYEAGTLSDVTVAGQDRVTETSRLVIEPGDAPLYIIASSQRPNIWRFSGQVDRITRLVVFPQGGDRNVPNVGVIGLPTSKITYLQNFACFRYFDNPNAGAGRQAKAIIENILKRPIDRIVSSYRLPLAMLPSGNVHNLWDGQEPSARTTG